MTDRLAQRKRQFLLSCPLAFLPGQVLYVGAKPERMEMLDLFLEAGSVVDILEIWSPNVEALLRWKGENGRVRKIMKGDVRTMDLAGRYDVAVWYHGPEHVEKEALPFCLANLETMARKVVALGMPWGVYRQGPAGGNVFETHRTSLYPADLEAFGYKTSTIGEMDRPGSNLLAWKVKP